MHHIPVLLTEVIDVLLIRDGERVLDCTFGGGGHTVAILNSAHCYVLGIDRDPDASDRAASIKNSFNERFDYINVNFSCLGELLGKIGTFDAVLFDFGISSFQIDDASRGFSFSRNGALDMRMSKSGLSAFDVINSFSVEDLSDIIRLYGDEHQSYKIASAIVNARKLRQLETTTELRDVVRAAVGFDSTTKRFSKIDAATRTFQAIRIFVNDELREISNALDGIFGILNDGARIATVAFHALEDRIVKNWAKSNENFISKINREVIRPSRAEIISNPRSRSAVLRSFRYNGDAS